jgi:hypothetical protein
MKYSIHSISSALLILIVLTGILPACQGGGKGMSGKMAANPQELSGTWIAAGLKKRILTANSVVEAYNRSHMPYAMAISISMTNPDSVICYNGLQRWSLPAVYQADTLVELKNARPGKSVFLEYQARGDKSITMFDGTSGDTHMDRFEVVRTNRNDGYLDFVEDLQRQLFAGRYAVDADSPSDITFSEDGSIFNLPRFDHYELCLNGDCFVAGPNVDILKLSNVQHGGGEAMAAFRFSAKKDTLTIYELNKPNTPDGMGNYTLGTPMYRLLRTATALNAPQKKPENTGTIIVQ